MDKLRHGFRIQYLTQFHELLGNPALLHILINIADQAAIELNHLRLKLHYLINIGITTAKIIDNDGRASVRKWLHTSIIRP